MSKTTTKNEMEQLVEKYNALQRAFQDGQVKLSKVLAAEKKAANAKYAWLKSQKAVR